MCLWLRISSSPGIDSRHLQYQKTLSRIKKTSEELKTKISATDMAVLLQKKKKGKVEILIEKSTNTAVKADRRTLPDGQQTCTLFVQYTKSTKLCNKMCKAKHKYCSMPNQLLHALPHNHDTYCSIPMYTNKSVYNKAHLLHRENG